MDYCPTTSVLPLAAWQGQHLALQVAFFIPSAAQTAASSSLPISARVAAPQNRESMNGSGHLRRNAIPSSYRFATKQAVARKPRYQSGCLGFNSNCRSSQLQRPPRRDHKTARMGIAFANVSESFGLSLTASATWYAARS